MRDSSDPFVASNCPSLYAGRSFSPAKAVEDAESILYFQKLLGSPAKGRAGLGFIPRVPFPDKGTKEHRKLVCDTIFEEHDKQLLEDTIQKYSAAASKKDPEAPISAPLCSSTGFIGAIMSGMTSPGKQFGLWEQI